MQNDAKSHIVTLLLAIFLGGLGIHRFYLGLIPSGVLRLILFLLTFIPLLGLVFGLASFAWWIVDIILVATKSLKPADGSAYV